MKLLVFTLCSVMGMTSVASASLGSFSASNGTDSVTVSFPAMGLPLSAVPNSGFTATNATYSVFWTEASGNANKITGFDANATVGATSVDFGKVTFAYNSALETLDISNNGAEKIRISDVASSGITAGLALGQIMPTVDSMISIISGGVTTNVGPISAVPEPSSFLFGGLVLGMVGAGRVVRKRFAKKNEK